MQSKVVEDPESTNKEVTNNSRRSISQSIDQEPQFYSKQNYLEPFQISSEPKKSSFCMNCWTRLAKIFK